MLATTMSCCIGLHAMAGMRPTFMPVVITRDQQLQWSRVEILYLEDIQINNGSHMVGLY